LHLASSHAASSDRQFRKMSLRMSLQSSEYETMFQASTYMGIFSHPDIIKVFHLRQFYLIERNIIMLLTSACCN
jgi:hypothetical protein